MNFLNKNKWTTFQPVSPPRVTPPTGYKIPLIIHQSYASYRLPPNLSKYVQSWIDLNPAFEHRYYDDRAMTEYMHKHGSTELIRSYDYIYETFPKNGGAFRADLFRLLLLQREGGIWGDADLVLLTPILDFWQPDDQFRCHINKKNLLFSPHMFIITIPAHPFVEQCIKNITKLKFYEKRFEKPLELLPLTGPPMWLRSIRELANNELTLGTHRIHNRSAFTYTIYPKSYRQYVEHRYRHARDELPLIGVMHYRWSSLRKMVINILLLLGLYKFYKKNIKKRGMK